MWTSKVWYLQNVMVHFFHCCLKKYEIYKRVTINNGSFLSPTNNSTVDLKGITFTKGLPYIMVPFFHQNLVLLTSKVWHLQKDCNQWYGIYKRVTLCKGPFLSPKASIIDVKTFTKCLTLCDCLFSPKARTVEFKDITFIKGLSHIMVHFFHWKLEPLTPKAWHLQTVYHL